MTISPSAGSSPESVFEQLSLPPPSESWRADWGRSMRCLPAPIPFLDERYVGDACSRIRLPEAQRAALVGALGFFKDQPLWKLLAWHQHRLLFADGRLPPDPVDCWPIPPPVDEPAALYMALIFLSGLPNVFAHHSRRGIPEDVTADTLSDLAVRLNGFRSTRGHYGLDSHRWTIHYFAGRLYKLGRLQYMMDRFPYAYRAFRHRRTHRVVVLSESGARFRADGRHASAVGGGESQDVWTAELVEDDLTIRGTAVAPDGRAVADALTLDKSDWTCILRKDDPVWDLHIPATGRMDFDECGASLGRAVAFFPKHFPEFPFKAFTCHSWFLDRQLEQFLGPDSNIVQFMREVYLLPVPGASGRGMMNRAFGGPVADLRAAPRDTALRRAVLAHLERGGFWYDGALVLFAEDLDWGRQVYRRRAVVDQPKSRSPIHGAANQA